MYFLTESIKDLGQIYGIISLVIARGLIGIGGARLMSRKFLSMNI